jgi:hypothetical protein
LCALGKCEKTVTTNADGRTDEPLLAGAEFQKGEYELFFRVGPYFGSRPEDSFLNEIPINPRGLCAFLAQAGQGINYAKGGWHHPLVALYEVSEFIVIDRGGAGSNREEVRLGEPVVISETDLNGARVCSPPPE